MTETKRTFKSDKAKAEDALAVTQRKVAKYEAEVKRHGDAKREAEIRLEAAKKRRDYLAKDPALLAEDAAVHHVRAGMTLHDLDDHAPASAGSAPSGGEGT